MRKVFFFILICSLSVSVQAQKKNKSKGKENTNFQAPDSLAAADTIPPPPVSSKSSKKGKTTTTNYVKKDDKKDSKKGNDKKDDKKGKKDVSTNFKAPETAEPTPVADTSKKFIGVIKYRMTTDDPADNDSMFIIFGENQIRVTMFTPGYREGQIFEDNSIINFIDSSFLEIDVRNKTYLKEKLGLRNQNFGITLTNSKKTTQLMNIACQEYKGEMTDSEEVYEAACLFSDKYQYMSAMDFNFLNIQAVVKGYRIVLGWRTKTEDNQNTFIMAYKIEPGDTAPYFDLSQYKAK
ncbi:MAG: hypothetical protein HOP10_08295 [Chitinophagaceae bacterium]|nr:hypothetical protein [Chitinophagaceae bacterium]